jgi:hypothetical protein
MAKNICRIKGKNKIHKVMEEHKEGNLSRAAARKFKTGNKPLQLL